jgi:hypothetical protein
MPLAKAAPVGRSMPRSASSICPFEIGLVTASLRDRRSN